MIQNAGSSRRRYSGLGLERAPHKSKEFDFISEKSRFTDDSVLTLATADAILHGYGYMEVFKYWGRCYPHAGYGERFFRWCLSDEKEQGESFGNGSAMRVSPVAWAFDTLDEVLAEAKKKRRTEPQPPRRIKGASAVAAAIFLARTGKSKDEIKEYIEKEFGYDLSRTVGKIRKNYKFDATCQGSVPEAAHSLSCIRLLRRRAAQRGLARRRLRHTGLHRRSGSGSLLRPHLRKMGLSAQRPAPAGGAQSRGRVQQKIPRLALQLLRLRRRGQLRRALRKRRASRPAQAGSIVLPLWVRSPETDEEVWAFAAGSGKKSGPVVCFCTDTSVIFDYLRAISE